MLDFYGNSKKHWVEAGNYGSLGNPKTSQANAIIQSDIIDDDVLRLFVAHRSEYEDSIKAMCNYQQRMDTVYYDAAFALECLDEFYQVYVSDSLYDSLGWSYYQHPTDGQGGILAWVDIADLPRGRHTLSVRTPLEYNYAIIPFYKSKRASK